MTYDEDLIIAVMDYHERCTREQAIEEIELNYQGQFKKIAHWSYKRLIQDGYAKIDSYLEDCIDYKKYGVRQINEGNIYIIHHKNWLHVFINN